MGIGIEERNHLSIWQVPLIGGEDKQWLDNTWIVEHLRQLADKIEDENPRIMNIGIKTDCGYKIPNLILDVYLTSK